MTKEEKTKQAFEMIEQGVKDVYSSDNFRKYLSCCSKFRYGLNGFRIIDWIVFFSKDGSDLKCTVQKYKQCEEQLARFLK